MSGSEQAEAAVMSGASRSARQQWCDFIVSALASLAVTLAKLTIAFTQEEVTSNDASAIHEGLVTAKTLGEEIAGHEKWEQPFALPPPCSRSRHGSIT
jgi:hypothetical protein